MSYTCGRCGAGPTGMYGHYGRVCHVAARIGGRQGVAALLDNPFHFCCPDDCELLHADGSPKPAEVEPAEQTERAVDSHCHVVRDGDTTPCTARPGEPHVDEQGDAYVTVELNGRGNR